ncbi:MAG: M20/M25/M40 family metallo-hydrolase [Planctomycetota bacterium]|nr:MAG: M20/M25/M40 family metallo-hydrolase [Planctomycetota bacterium]
MLLHSLLLALFAFPQQSGPLQAAAAPPPGPEVTATSSDPDAPVFDVAAAVAAAPDDPLVAAILNEGMENNQVMLHMEELVDGIGPRLTSSSNLTEACEWAAERFRQFGLENARLERWGEFPVGFDRRHSRGRLVQPEKLELVFGTHAWTPGTNGPVRGPVRLAPADDAALEAARGSFAGAWVLIGSPRPKWDSSDDDFPSRLGAALSAEGIAGVVEGTRDLIHTGGRYRLDPDHLPTRVSIRLRGDQHKHLQELLAAGKELVAEFDIDQRFVPGPIPLYNVIAEIPGREKPEELVIFGGHIDSWDGARGAQDNGTGTCTTLEAARILAAVGAQPRRTIRFMLWSGEEQGLLGSSAYIEQHPEENERISAVIVHDGGTNACSGITATPLMLPLFERAFAPLVAATAADLDEDLRFRIRKVDALPYPIGSDHDAYLGVGVPGFFWSQNGTQDYNFIHHTQHDYMEHVKEKYQRYTSTAVALTAWRLANAEEMVPRADMLQSAGPRRRLGVSLAGDTLKIESVTAEGLAAKAGLKAGDTVVEVDGTALSSRGDLSQALSADGERKRVVILRDGQRLAFWFDWDKRTAEPAQP